jgi:hypothetical protein
MPKPRINLDALAGDAGEVEFGGELHAVLPIDGAGFLALMDISQDSMTEGEAMRAMFTIAKRCVPTLADKIDSMNLQQIQGIMQLAKGHVVEVEQHPKSKRRPSGVVPPKGKG